MIKLEKAKISEAQKIRKFENKIWKKEVISKYDVAMFVRFGWCYVAKKNNKIVGIICSYPTKNGEVYVCDWAVGKEYRREKIGLKLYKKLIGAVKGRTIVSFIDPANTPSLEAHKRFGFKMVKRIKNPYNLHEGYRIFVRLQN